jgi:hypothetical protein
MVSLRSGALAAALALSQPSALAAEPILSLAGTLPASGDYGAVLAAIDAIGAEATSITLYWDELQHRGAYRAEPDWPAIAQAVYPERGLRIQMTLAAIDTLADRRPVEFRDLAWDDPQAIRAFADLVAEVLSRMPDVDLVSVAVGNEVDGLLTGDAVDEYARFFEEARRAIHALRPGVPVTVKVTWPGLRDRPDIRALARRGDALSITWYPMDGAFHFAEPDLALRELASMATLADGPWELSEVGYPSDGCGASSPAAQARFHAGLTEAVAAQPGLRLVQRVWSHDISDAEVEGYLAYHRTDTRCFASFLGSLGLRTGSDAAKPAFEALVER